jgi:ATP-dependent DNA helicase Rep
MGDDIRMHDRKTNTPVSREEGRARLAKLMDMLDKRPDGPAA